MCDTPLCEMAKESYATPKVFLFCRLLAANRAATWSVFLFLILTTSLQAQEPVRTAAPAPLSRSFRRSPEAFFYLGPLQAALIGSLGVQYTDNVNLTTTDKISDLSFTEEISLDTTWVMSHLNTLQLSLGGAVIENFYGNGRSQVNFAIAPNSMLEFKFALGDYNFRFYDQFSYIQNPTTDPTATNTANLNNLTNTFGAQVEKDLNIAVLSFSADYTYNDQSGRTAQGQANPSTSGSRETFRTGPEITLRLSPTILYGFGVSATRSTGAHSANVNSLNAGPFIKGDLSKQFQFDMSGGISIVDTKPSVPLGYYLSAAIRYQANRHWKLLMSGSHELVFSTGTGLTEQDVLLVESQLDVTRFITFDAAPFINYGDVKTTSTQGALAGLTTGPYTQFGIRASLAWTPRKRWTTKLSYDFVRREASKPGGTSGSANSYTVNTIGFQIGYSF